MITSIALLAGIAALAAVPPLFFINRLMGNRNKEFDRSHLIEGTVVDLDFDTRNDGKTYPIVEYTAGGKTVQFNNYARVHGAVIGDTVQIEIGADRKARVFTNINAKIRQVTASYMILCLVVGVGALGWHFLKL